MSSAEPTSPASGAKEGGGSPERMPVWFASHGGGPCFFMEPEGPFRDIAKGSDVERWMGTMGSYSPKPKAILVVSAHWEADGDAFEVTADENPSLLFDYYGFPAHTYELKYPSPGSPDLAAQVKALVEAGTGKRCSAVTGRGLDHGVFVPLLLGWPDADVPVVQLSLAGTLDPELHVQLGRALAPLRDQGVLIFASGQTTHSLREMRRSPGAGVEDWAREFAAWFTATLTDASLTAEQRLQRALRMSDEAPNFARAHPRTEHIVPAYVALGAAGGTAAIKAHETWALGNMCLSSFLFA